MATKVFEFRDFHFQLPMRSLFAGSSQVGKTSLILDIIQNQKNLFNFEFNRIYYYYPSLLCSCPIDINFESKSEISLIAGFPSLSEINEFEIGSLVIIDDQRNSLRYKSFKKNSQD